MTDTELVINNLEKTKTGLSITYIRLPRDARKNGLIWQHNVVVPFGSDYDDEIEAVDDALNALLVDVLDDEDRAEPVDVIDEEDKEADDDDNE